MSFDLIPPAVRTLSGQWYAVMGIDRDDPAKYRSAMEWAKAPADEAWVFSCVRRIYEAAASVSPVVYVKVGRELIPAAEEPTPEGDALQQLLDDGNPVDMDGTQIRAYDAASEAVWGESFLRKVRGRLGGPPQELFWLRAPDIKVDSDDGRTPRSYTMQTPNGGPQETYQPRDVIHLKTPNLVDPLRGLAPLSSIGSDISAGVAWAAKTNALVQNDSVPPGYWQIPKDAEFAKQDENLVRRTLRALRGPRARGKVPVMPVGIEFKGISLTPQASEMIANRKISRMSVCAAIGVPLVLAGDDDKNTVYGNLREAERVFWRGRVIGMCDRRAATLNARLVPEFDPTRQRLKIAYDYSTVEALKPAWDVEWNAWLAGIYSQGVVPNEFRRHFRIGADVPWGDKPVPRTQAALKIDPAVDPNAAIASPSLDPENEADLSQPGQISGDADAAAGLRAYGRDLYRHPAVRAWVATPDQPLEIPALFAGRSVSTDTRLLIEAGLRRRDSAAVIADQLEVAP